MKTKKSDTLLQRQVLEKKLQTWRKLTHERKPPSGWIKAIRGALGMTAKQLADRMETDQPGVARIEEREARGAVTLETLERAARAMNCKVIYAIVPDDGYVSLEEILNQRAETVAKTLMKKVSHSMRLEAQDVDHEDKQEQLKRLARELKESLDPRLWGKK
jgi:predicted DNA-binding mobile mystery protein A